MAYRDPADQAAASRRHYERNRDRIKERAIAQKKRQRAENRVIVREAKAAPCADCGHTFPPVAMDFDHVRGEKVADVATLAYAPVASATLLKEIAKCDLVCACCHRVRTFGLDALEARL